jgi:hypothetical protein
MAIVLEADPEQIREVFASYGWAMHAAQGVEREAAILLAIVFNPRFGASTPDERRLVFSTTAAATLGQLVSKLNTLGQVPSDLGQRLSESVRTRNWLAHDYFWDRAGHFLTPEGRHVMITELQRHRVQLQALDEALT